MRLAENERSEVWSLSRIIPRSGGYELSSFLRGSYPWFVSL